MIHELREYVAAPGRSADLHARFREHTFDLFDQHGLSVQGFWVDKADPSRIVYLLEFENERAQQAAWAAFNADEHWREVKAQSEANGPITADMTSRTLETASYWADRNENGSAA